MIHTCRICLRIDKSITNDVKNYAEIIKKIAQIEIILNEGYPNKVCHDCTNDLLNAELLREMLLEINDIKKDQLLVQQEEVSYNNEDILYEYDAPEDPDSIIKFEPESDKEMLYSPPKKKKQKKEDVKVVLKETERKISRPSPVLQVREPIARAPVKEVDAASLKKEHYYECHYCNTPQTNLESHMTETHPDEPLIFRCRFCDVSYQKIASLKDHVYKVHKLRRSIPCDECGKMFSLPCRLKIHKIKMHSDEKKLVCPICTARFKLKNNLKLHMRVHSGEKRYKCEFCEKAYAHYSDWKAHHMSHTGDWKYFCPICNKGFYKPSALKIHQKSH